MSAIQPAHKEIIAELRERLEKGPLCEFETRKYAKAARGMVSDDPENGYTAFGILSCGERDEKMMREYHSKAILASGNAPLQYLNYSCSLKMLGLLADARVQAEIACEKSSDDSFALDALIHILYLSHDVEEMNQRITQWEKKTEKAHPLRADEQYLEMLRMCQGMQDDSEEDISEMCLAGARTAFKGWTTPEEDDAWKRL